MSSSVLETVRDDSLFGLEASVRAIQRHDALEQSGQGLGVRGFVRKYARSPSILVSLLDDEPHRGAFLLRDIPWRQDETSSGRQT